ALRGGLDVALRALGGLGGELARVLAALALVSLGGGARVLDDLVGLRARFRQALAVFGEDPVGLFARVLRGVDRFFDRFLAAVQRGADARERETGEQHHRDAEHEQR